jgi:hypothetical protein
MNSQDDLLPVVLVLVTGIFIVMIGLWMLVSPKSLSADSILYRFMLRRYFQFLDKETKKTGKLRRSQVQIYGLLLVISGIAGIIFLLFGS